MVDFKLNAKRVLRPQCWLSMKTDEVLNSGV